MPNPADYDLDFRPDTYWGDSIAPINVKRQIRREFGRLLYCLFYSAHYFSFNDLPKGPYHKRRYFEGEARKLRPAGCRLWPRRRAGTQSRTRHPPALRLG